MIRVALTMRVAEDPAHGERRDSISHDWLSLLRHWEMTPLPVPNIGIDAGRWLRDQKPDLVVLTGGGDPAQPTERAATERTLLDHASEARIPVLGVCRGLQYINLFYGGALCDIDGHVATPHPVSIEPIWHGHYGARATVNSYHDLGIRDAEVGDGLIAAARDDDGNIEAACHADLPLAAIMWHPERTGALDGDKTLVEALLANAGSAT